MHEKHSAVVPRVVINDYQPRNSRPRETEGFGPGPCYRLFIIKDTVLSFPYLYSIPNIRTESTWHMLADSKRLTWKSRHCSNRFIKAVGFSDCSG